MFSQEEQRLLDAIEEALTDESPSLARRFELADDRRRRRAEARLFLSVLAGAIVLSAGLATTSFDPSIGLLIAALGCALLTYVVTAARRHPVRS